MTQGILLASQGIYNRKRELFATELLFRNEEGATAWEMGEDKATSEVLVNHCSSITDEVEHLQRPAFINVSAEFLLFGAFLPVDPKSVFVELVERIKVTDEIIDAVKSWKKLGFRFALDDFEFTEDWRPLVELADVIKVDVLGQDPQDVIARKNALSELFSGEWLAERIETPEEYQIYMDAGFTLFQGYFLGRPKIITGKRIRPEQMSAVEILRVTVNPESGFDEVSTTVARDPNLSIQILKMVNSPLYKLERPINSLREAIVFLGLEQMRRWAMVLSMLSASKNCMEAQRIVLQRAKFCETYAKSLGVKELEQAFMVGLLSGIDILLEVDGTTFIENLSLSNDLKEAVLNKKGRLGKVLQLALNLERIINVYPEKLAKTKQNVLNTHHEAFLWTEDILSSYS